MTLSAESGHETPSVLVVEANGLTCDLVRVTFAREFGLRVVCTTRTEDAIGLIRRESPGLVLLDLSHDLEPESAVLLQLRAELAAAAIPAVELTPATWAHAKQFLAEDASIDATGSGDRSMRLALALGYLPSGPSEREDPIVAA